MASKKTLCDITPVIKMVKLESQEIVTWSYNTRSQPDHVAGEVESHTEVRITCMSSARGMFVWWKDL